MKVQIVGYTYTPLDAQLLISCDGIRSRIPLPTHEKLTEESLKTAIKTGMDDLNTMVDRMSLLEDLRYKEIELD